MADDEETRVLRAIYHLTLAGSLDSTTNVVVDLAEVAAMSKVSTQIAQTIFDRLVENDAADYTGRDGC